MKKEEEDIEKKPEVVEATIVKEKLPHGTHGNSPRLSVEKQAELFKAIAHKSYSEVAKEFGILDHYGGNALSAGAYVSATFKRVSKAPELYGISPDAVAVVAESVEIRNKTKKNPIKKIVELETFKDKLDAVRNDAAEILIKKLRKVNRSAKDIDGISFRDIKDVLSMAIDKSRLYRGESTDNIVHFSKVDTSKMTGEEALQLVLKAREALIEGNK